MTVLQWFNPRTTDRIFLHGLPQDATLQLPLTSVQMGNYFNGIGLMNRSAGNQDGGHEIGRGQKMCKPEKYR